MGNTPVQGKIICQIQSALLSILINYSVYGFHIHGLSFITYVNAGAPGSVETQLSSENEEEVETRRLNAKEKCLGKYIYKMCNLNIFNSYISYVLLMQYLTTDNPSSFDYLFCVIK